MIWQSFNLHVNLIHEAWRCCDGSIAILDWLDGKAVYCSHHWLFQATRDLQERTMRWTRRNLGLVEKARTVQCCMSPLAITTTGRQPVTQRQCLTTTSDSKSTTFFTLLHLLWVIFGSMEGKLKTITDLKCSSTSKYEWNPSINILICQ